MSERHLLFPAVVLLLGLACGGFGTPEVDPGEPVSDGNPIAEAEPVTPDTLFVTIANDEAPPFSGQAVPCPPGTTKIRHPISRGLELYCADGSGTRTGTFTEWSGSQLRAAGTYEGGVLEGTFTRWENASGTTRKVRQETWSAGRLEGDLAVWDSQGRLTIRGRHEGGLRHGRFLEHRLTDGEVAFGGVCYQLGEELWRTTDEAEFVSRSCASIEIAG